MKKLRCFLWLCLSLMFATVSYGQGKDPCATISSGFDQCLGDVEFSEDTVPNMDMEDKGFDTAPFSLEIHGKISVYQTYTKVKVKEKSKD